MESSKVSAVLFVKDVKGVAAFYSQALGMKCSFNDEYQSVLNCCGFDLTVHQIPKHIANEITIKQPPERRLEGAIRLSFPVRSIEETRAIARSLGGELDDAPPAWANSNNNDFLGHDPEGNVFHVSQHTY